MRDLTPLGYAQRTWALDAAEVDDDDDAVELLLTDLGPTQLGHLLHAFIGQLAGQMTERYGHDGARDAANERALNVAINNSLRADGE